MGQTPILLCNKGAEENSAVPRVRITEGFSIEQGLGTAAKCLLAPEGKAWRSSLAFASLLRIITAPRDVWIEKRP